MDKQSSCMPHQQFRGQIAQEAVAPCLVAFALMHLCASSKWAVLHVLLVLRVMLCCSSTLLRAHPAHQATARRLHQAQPSPSDSNSNAFNTASTNEQSSGNTTTAVLGKEMNNSKTLPAANADGATNLTTTANTPSRVASTSVKKDSNQSTSGNGVALPSNQQLPDGGTNQFTVTLDSNNITFSPPRSTAGTTAGGTTAILVLPVTIRSNSGNK
jgi:hypothetical protein